MSVRGGQAPTFNHLSEIHPLPEMSRRRWRLLVIASIGVFLSALDSTILAVALPAVSADLQLTYSEALWVQASYLVVVTVLLIPVGRWSERVGPYAVNWWGNLVFGLFSLAAAFAPNGLLLIGTRVFQGVGAALVMTTGAAIVTAVFPAAQRGRALGLNMLGSTMGQMVGPPLGGIVVTHLGWPWIFLLKVPIVALTLIAGWDLLGAERRDRLAAAARAAVGASRDDAAADSRLDVRGAALLGAVLTALFVPLIFSPLWGWGSARTLAPLVLAIVLAAAFVYVESRTDDPILDLGLFRRSRVFTAATAGSILYMAAAYGVTIFTAVFLQVVQGESAQTAGFLLLIQPVIMTIITPFAGRLSDRVGSQGLSAIGMVVTAAGTAQLALFSASTPMWRVALALATLGLGISIFSAPNFSAIMGSVRRSELGVASGMFAASRFCGMGISVAVLGAIAASQLGPEGGRVILLGTEAGIENAEAFTAGYRQAMLVGTALALVGALVALVRERKPEAAGSDMRQ
jgi:EmrB/QacA subfamily drug resistance transporter